MAGDQGWRGCQGSQESEATVRRVRKACGESEDSTEIPGTAEKQNAVAQQKSRQSSAAELSQRLFLVPNCGRG